jgi:hypothetical protein
MKLGLLMGSAAAFFILGAAGARAETIYITEPDAVVAPGYVYMEPAEPDYAVAAPQYEIIEQPSVVISPPRGRIVQRPAWAAPWVAPREVIDDDDDGIVTTGTSVGPTQCMTDSFGLERCF